MNKRIIVVSLALMMVTQLKNTIVISFVGVASIERHLSWTMFVKILAMQNYMLCSCLSQ